ncbi:hypothetical protein NP493_804g01027 [Ridgeia piscesae]|uniref:Uncharacterized protein n=1 Tax=Ridgeia piscesae TaxID=27915 RepID=A0AAD9KND5_RIDPI|nr:hypothetical protein NP493_804g01027 [Ridgeia piscesae]
MPTAEEANATAGLLDYQRTELDRYRYAVNKMGQDILTLRQRIIELEKNNSDLRRQNMAYTDTSRLLQDAHEIDGMPLPELAARYASIKHKFMQQTNQLRQYKERVLEVQNELIKFFDHYDQVTNDTAAINTKTPPAQINMSSQREFLRILARLKLFFSVEWYLAVRGKSSGDATVWKDETDAVLRRTTQVAGLLKMADAHQAQNGLMQRLQTKAAKLKSLEEACKKQEKVIEKLEQLNTRGAEKSDGQVNEALKEENVRLRDHINYLQLEENARQWGKEKSQLARKLQEAELERDWSPAPEPRPLRHQHHHLPRDYGRPLSPPVSRRYSKAPPRRDRQRDNVWPLDYYLKTK